MLVHIAGMLGEVDLEQVANELPANIFRQWQDYFAVWPNESDRADRRTLAMMCNQTGTTSTDELDNISVIHPYFEAAIPFEEKARQLLEAARKRREQHGRNNL